MDIKANELRVLPMDSLNRDNVDDMNIIETFTICWKV